ITFSAAPAQLVANLVPVQITVPAQQAGGVPKTITIHVPSSALANGVAGQQLQAILSSPTAAQTFSLEACRAAEIIQRKLNTALENNGINLPPQLQQYSQLATTQVDGPNDEPLGMPPKSIKKTATRPSQPGATSSSHNIQPTVSADRSIMDTILYERLKATQVSVEFTYLHYTSLGTYKFPRQL
ncbi:putative transcription initiation factor IIA subunit 1-like, partial [Homarus americanus]